MKSLAVLLILSGVVCLMHSLGRILAPDSAVETNLLALAEPPIVLLFPLLSAVLITAGTALLSWMDESGRDRWA